jgi:hypothetical protein
VELLQLLVAVNVVASSRILSSQIMGMMCSPHGITNRETAFFLAGQFPFLATRERRAAQQVVTLLLLLLLGSVFHPSGHQNKEPRLEHISV